MIWQSNVVKDNYNNKQLIMIIVNSIKNKVGENNSNLIRNNKRVILKRI